jgi:hypothetical protein
LPPNDSAHIETTDLRRIQAEIDKKQTKIYLLEHLVKECQASVARSKELETSLLQLKHAHNRLLSEHEALKQTMSGLLHSHSWRITAPLRAMLELLRSGK